MFKKAILILILTATSALSHSFYDAYCCNGDSMNGDCQPIPSTAVSVSTDGYVIELKPGDHRLVTKVNHYTVPFQKAYRSPDGGYHACLYPNEETMRCFYAPESSS